MPDLSILVLTLLACWYILINIKASSKKSKYRQSDVHKVVKSIIEQDYLGHSSQQSQSEKHAEKNSIRVIFLEDKAYWVVNNVFYCANAVNGTFDRETAQPINTENITKEEIDKLLFILDKLGNGSSNDSGGSGNKRF